MAIKDFESSQGLLLGLGGEDGQVGTNVCEGHTIMRKPSHASAHAGDGAGINT